MSIVREPEDATLVRRARDGEEEAFALLYRRYRKQVWELSFYLCGRNHHEAEEALQETFLKAWRGLSSFGGRSTFKSWLLAIGRNVCIDRLRRAAGPTLQLDVLVGPGAHDARQPIGRCDELDRIALRQALGGLPKDEREAWLLVDVVGCSSREAARVVGVRAATTMRSRVARARAQIASAMCEDPSQTPVERREAEVVTPIIERAAIGATAEGAGSRT